MPVKMTQESLNAARMIFEHPLTKEILLDMEESAINGAINAKASDISAVSAYLAEARIIRKFMSRLQFTINQATDSLERNKPQD